MRPSVLVIPAVTRMYARAGAGALSEGIGRTVGRPLTPRQAHLLGTLRRADEPWLELWQLAAQAGYTIKVAAANVRELRHRQLVVTRPTWSGLSAIEVSLRGPV